MSITESILADNADHVGLDRTEQIDDDIMSEYRRRIRQSAAKMIAPPNAASKEHEPATISDVLYEHLLSVDRSKPELWQISTFMRGKTFSADRNV